VAGSRAPRRRQGGSRSLRAPGLRGRPHPRDGEDAGVRAEGCPAAAPRPRCFRIPPAPLDTPLLFAGVKGGHLNLHNWRRDEWKPALTAAGLEYRRPYALRHTFVSECIAAGIATFEIARMAGTSVLQIEKTYGHLLPDAIERGRAALEAFDARSDQAFGQLSGNAD
jgi:integrase